MERSAVATSFFNVSTIYYGVRYGYSRNSRYSR